MSYEMSSRNFAFDTFVQNDGSDGQAIISSPEQEDLVHVMEPFLDAMIQLEILDKCVERRHQSQRLALSMGIGVENNTEDSLPELEQINSIETLANDKIAVDMTRLGALHEPSVPAKMNPHTNILHHWIETNGNCVRHVIDTLVKYYDTSNFLSNSASSHIKSLLSEALTIKNKLDEKVEHGRKPYTQQILLQTRAVAVVRSALEPILMDFRVQEENMWQKHKEKFYQGLRKCMAPSIETSAKGDGDNTSDHGDDDNFEH
ncbi:hypothetical protein DFS33DRAFT_320196 [Desarmillaria ectypa]|nr:hypothetical protein DFS33DRAFT_320196 [Desarmillaria ectypa]